MVRIVVQRVSQASVQVEGETVAEIERGLLLLVGIEVQDTTDLVKRMADRMALMRVFEDDAGKVNVATRDAGGTMLVISQFTLLADTSRGRRPSFVGAARPEVDTELIDHFVHRLQDFGYRVEQGHFGAHMDVSLVNDGPFTLMLES